MDGDSKATDAAPVPSGVGTPDKRRRRGRRWLVEWAVVVLVAVAVALVVRTFVFETYYIPSGSMEPTLEPGDRIVVDKLSFHMHPVERGDIVVFRRPPAWPKQYPDLVKRVIGLPGETIAAHGGNVYVDGRLLPEPWLPRGVTTGVCGSGTGSFGPVHIPAGDYFMMGDHRADSADSRCYGPVPGRDIVGEVIFRYWPLSHIGVP